jgi:hypothetical protein
MEPEVSGDASVARGDSVTGTTEKSKLKMRNHTVQHRLPYYGRL